MMKYLKCIKNTLVKVPNKRDHVHTLDLVADVRWPKYYTA